MCLNLEVDGKVSLSWENIVTSEAVNTHKVFTVLGWEGGEIILVINSQCNIYSLSLYQKRFQRFV